LAPGSFEPLQVHVQDLQPGLRYFARVVHDAILLENAALRAADPTAEADPPAAAAPAVRLTMPVSSWPLCLISPCTTSYTAKK
jgi:hypothetical protein